MREKKNENLKNRLPQGEQGKLAKRLQMSHIALNAILNGWKHPSVKLAIAIEKETLGLYRADEFRPELKGWRSKK